MTSNVLDRVLEMVGIALSLVVYGGSLMLVAAGFTGTFAHPSINVALVTLGIVALSSAIYVAENY